MEIGECSGLPSTDVLESQPGWVFFIPRAELVKEANWKARIQSVYDNPRVVTLEDTPGWKLTVAPKHGLSALWLRFTIAGRTDLRRGRSG